MNEKDVDDIKYGKCGHVYIRKAQDWYVLQDVPEDKEPSMKFVKIKMDVPD